MNKITSILSLAALCMGFVACDDVEESLSKPQTNPQEPMMEIDGLQVQVPQATAEAVDLKAYDNGDRAGLVPVLEITKLDNFPESYQLKGEMKIGDDKDFTKSRTIKLVTDGMTLMAPVEDWETAHIDLFTKNPRTTKSFVEINLYAVNGTAKIRLMNGDSFEFGERELSVTPLDAVIPVDEVYYIVAGDQKIQMTPANPENVYDPPTFSAVVEVPVGSTIEGKVVSESGQEYGVESAASAKADGTLAIGGASIVFDHPGPQQLTVNMEKLTYNIASAFPMLYAYGSTPTSGYALTTYDFVNYAGFAGFSGSAPSFRLASENVASPAVQWGLGHDDDGEAVAGTLVEAESPMPIPLEAASCYFIKANISALTYSAEQIRSFGVIGTMNQWSGDIAMTATDSDHMVWTADVDFKDGDMFKIRTNGSWDGPNIGGGNADDPADLSNLKEHGADMIWENGTGTFTITLNLASVPYSITFVQK